MEFVRVEGDEATLQLVASDSRRANEDDGSRHGRVGHQTGNFLISGDLLPVEILVLCQSVHDFLNWAAVPIAHTFQRMGRTAAFSQAK